MSGIDEVWRDPSRWRLAQEGAVTYLGLGAVIMDLESICQAQVKDDPEHAAYWAVMGNRLASMVYPPEVMFGSLQPPRARCLKDYFKEE